MNRSIRTLAQRGPLGPKWSIVIWYRVKSYVSSPRYQGWEETFINKKVADKFKEKLEKKFPERTVYVQEVYVLSDNKGKSGFVIEDHHERRPRKAALLNRWS